MNDETSSTAEFTRRAGDTVRAIDALRQSLKAIAALPEISFETLDRLAFVDEITRKANHALKRHTLDIAQTIPRKTENVASADVTPDTDNGEHQ